jgi:hypothetical protein
MKRNLLLAAVALFIVAGFSSCRKDRVCECTYSDGSTQSYTFHATKKVANLDCDMQEFGGATCELK